MGGLGEESLLRRRLGLRVVEVVCVLVCMCERARARARERDRRERGSKSKSERFDVYMHCMCLYTRAHEYRWIAVVCRKRKRGQQVGGRGGGKRRRRGKEDLGGSQIGCAGACAIRHDSMCQRTAVQAAWLDLTQ